MYVPRLRARQFEVFAVRDCAADFGRSGKVSPILEPVNPLDGRFARRMLDIADRGLSCGLVLNPSVGQLRGASEWREVGQFYVDQDLLGPHGLTVLSNAEADHASMSAWIEDLRDEGLEFPVDIFHELDLSVSLEGDTYMNVRWNIAEDRTVPAAYGLPLSGRPVVWANDPFPALLANREYVGRAEGIFSNRVGSFGSAGYIGVSDYLTVGRRFQPGGGPAYAVVIHFTYSVSGIVRLVHFCSDSNATQDDPGGKFLEALDKLESFVRANGVASNPAVGRFLQLHRDQHFPGLGQVKQLSMMNHMYVMNSEI